MTDAIKEAHEEPKFFHFSNECDLINKIIFGCSSKKFKIDNDIEKNDSLRDYQTIEQIKAVVALQKANTALINIGLKFEERRDKLTILFNRKHKDLLMNEFFLLEA